MTARQIVLDTFAAQHPDEFDDQVDPADRFALVTILDDDTVTFRRARSYPTVGGALEALGDISEGFVGEYLLDLDAVSVNDCCFVIYDDGATATVAQQPTPFDENHVAFA